MNKIKQCISIFFLMNGFLLAFPEAFIKNNIYITDLLTEEYVEIIKPFLPVNPIILEAGAHGGQDTVILSQSWPLGTLYAFEPVEKFVGFTKKAIEENRVTNAHLFPFALSATSGEQTFYYSMTVGAASSLLPTNDICDYQEIPMTVQCVNLDEWAEKNKVNHIDFMWLDMEGSELHVLKHAPQILSTVRVIITEINFREFRKNGTQFTGLYEFMTQNDFTLYKIWGSPTWQGTALFVRSSLLPATE